VTAAAATYPKSAVRDEAADVMCCCRELLCEPAFMKALVRLVAGNERGGQRERQRTDPVAFGAKDKGF